MPGAPSGAFQPGPFVASDMDQINDLYRDLDRGLIAEAVKIFSCA